MLISCCSFRKASLICAGIVCSLLFAKAANAGQWISKVLEFQRRERTFKVYCPTQLPPHPAVVLVFHGTSRPGHGADDIAAITHFDRVAEQNHFLVIFPEAYQGNWNDGRLNDGVASYRDGVDDIGFVDEILDDLTVKWKIDPRKIYATGYSNGGIFVQYLGAERSARFAAIAPVCGPMALHSFQFFHPRDPVSVLEIHGTDDPVVPYTGGAIAYEKGRVLSVEQCITAWVEHDGCERAPIRMPIAERDANDGCTPELFAWRRGRDKTAIELCRIIGGGHTWPGGNQFLSSFVLGNISRDFNGADLIWRFFHRHPKLFATGSTASAPSL
jgi:polyhydroxybutyrate depolymerase